jgi:hypothetical protein
MKLCCATTSDTDQNQFYHCRATLSHAILLLCVNAPFCRPGQKVTGGRQSVRRVVHGAVNVDGALAAHAEDPLEVGQLELCCIQVPFEIAGIDPEKRATFDLIFKNIFIKYTQCQCILMFLTTAMYKDLKTL